jgi:hypothetical protein
MATLREIVQKAWEEIEKKPVPHNRPQAVLGRTQAAVTARLFKRLRPEVLQSRGTRVRLGRAQFDNFGIAAGVRPWALTASKNWLANLNNFAFEFSPLHSCACT